MTDYQQITSMLLRADIFFSEETTDGVRHVDLSSHEDSYVGFRFDAITGKLLKVHAWE